MSQENALQLWTRLDAERATLMHRIERFASLTDQTLLTPEGGDPDRDGTANDWQSLGAMVLNHLTTKMILALFAPSRPFLRLDPGPALLAAAEAEGMSITDLEASLAAAERRAVKRMDQLSIRPKLFEAMSHILALGNVLVILGQDDKDPPIRVLNLKRYVVKRDIAGRLHTLVIRERVQFDELSMEAQEACPPHIQARYRNHVGPAGMVDFLILVRRGPDGKMVETQWVDDFELPGFGATYSKDQDMPYLVLTWRLADEANYGSGLVQTCEGDLEALSTLSRAVIEGAILASEYRWLLSPAAAYTPEDFKESQNGEVLRGQEGDLSLVNSAGQVGAAMQVQMAAAKEYIQRIGRVFLLSSAMTRDAERVTAEEIRMIATELETGLGGGYSRLAVDMQLPLGLWLLRKEKITFTKDEIEPTVVTGLDALSRNGDFENLARFLDKAVNVGNLPPHVSKWLKLDNLFTDFATMCGVDAKRYVYSAQEVEQADAAQREAEVQAETAKAAGQAAAQGAVQE
jgi:hypothetical protein